jgi:hypothetical protein
MVRYLLVSLCLACFGIVAFGVERAEETPEERARRVRVAIAVSSSAPAAAESTPELGCGRCTDDLEEARRVSRETGKPIVLFVSVAGCEGRAATLPAGVLAAKTATYDRDGKPATQPRVVVLLPAYRDWSPVITIAATLPGNSSADSINAAVLETKSKPALQPTPVAQTQAAPVIIPQQFTLPQLVPLVGVACPTCRQQ